jgi:hypothetical protein
MPQPAKPAVVIVDFSGIMNSVDPRDLPEGASEDQVNCCSFRLGELTSRGGLVPVTFEDD